MKMTMQEYYAWVADNVGETGTGMTEQQLQGWLMQQGYELPDELYAEPAPTKPAEDLGMKFSM